MPYSQLPKPSITAKSVLFRLVSFVQKPSGSVHLAYLTLSFNQTSFRNHFPTTSYRPKTYPVSNTCTTNILISSYCY
nr:MAG TPA: hypothetical protein [Caudoviricetes sp.]